MNILCITHADFESPGVIEDWARDRKYQFKIEKPYKLEKLSPIDSFDMLIVMGGPQSPLNISQDPYLELEIELIRQALGQNKSVLGFCLGAQLIGEALGAKTSRSPEKEVGVYPITLNKAAKDDPLLKGELQSFPVIHWHNDMPGLTPDSVLLAHSEGCPRQIVRYKSNVYGFQCHLEITLEGITKMIEASPEDLNPSKFTQSKETLLKQNYRSINDQMIRLLERFASLK